MMKILILEDRGIYVEEQEVEMPYPQAQQWVNSGYAEFVPVVQKSKAKAAEPKKAEPKKAKAKEEPKAE